MTNEGNVTLFTADKVVKLTGELGLVLAGVAVATILHVLLCITFLTTLRLPNVLAYT